MEDTNVSVGQQFIKELEQNPEVAIDFLDWCLIGSVSHETLADPKCNQASLELKENWVGARRAIPLKKAQRLMDETDDYEEYERIRRWAGKKGRPPTLRHTAIMALVRKHYLGETWREVTKRLCPCGLTHTPARLAKKCQPKIEAEARILKRLLKDCKIVFPQASKIT